MPFIKIWVHLVWATKNRKPLLTKEIRIQVFAHIQENAKRKNIYIDCLNGYIDHVHCVVSINQEQTISKIMQLLKGESSYWINKNNLCGHRFEWQTEYFAVSICESRLNAVRGYIKNQEEHHKKKTFEHEYQELINKYGFEIIEG